jgi:hypothetical protein
MARTLYLPYPSEISNIADFGLLISDFSFRIPQSKIRNLKTKEELTMGKMIIWETKMDVALARAKAENKNVLLDFFNPG